MTRCEYCGQEDANLNVKGQFFHKECYQNFLKEGALEEKEQEIKVLVEKEKKLQAQNQFYSLQIKGKVEDIQK